MLNNKCRHFFILVFTVLITATNSLAMSTDDQSSNDRSPRNEDPALNYFNSQLHGIKINFNRSAELNKYREILLENAQAHQNLLAKFKEINANNDNEALVDELLWRSLIALSKHYGDKDLKGKLLTYFSMMRFYLAHGVTPPGERDFMMDIFKRMQSLKRKYAAHHDDADAIVKWYYIYKGRFRAKLAELESDREIKKKHLSTAYEAFLKDIKLNSTATAYLLVADLILNQHFRPVTSPNGSSDKSGKALGYEFFFQGMLRKGKINEKSLIKPVTHRSIQKHAMIDSAKPPYMKRPRINSASYSSSPEDQSEAINMSAPQTTNDQIIMSAFDEIMKIQDDVPENNNCVPSYFDNNGDEDIVDNFVDDDVPQLIITQHANENLLPLRVAIKNSRDEPYDFLEVDNIAYQLQDVSGDNLHCLLNAMGVDAATVKQRLLAKIDQPMVRHAVANEIVSAARSASELHDDVKRAVNFAQFEQDMFAINQRDIERSLLLERNHNNGDENNALTNNTRGLHDDAFDLLRKRALSIDVVRTFIESHYSPNNAMVTLHDQSGSPLANLTSIDAICEEFNFGIKIHQRHDGIVRMVHSYVPEHATEIVMIYHEGFHFQQMISLGNLVIGELIDQENDDDEHMALEPQISMLDDDAQKKGRTIDGKWSDEERKKIIVDIYNEHAKRLPVGKLPTLKGIKNEIENRNLTRYVMPNHKFMIKTLSMNNLPTKRQSKISTTKEIEEIRAFCATEEGSHLSQAEVGLRFNKTRRQIQYALKDVKDDKSHGQKRARSEAEIPCDSALTYKRAKNK